MKTIIGLLLIGISSSAFAVELSPYLSYKNELIFLGDDYKVDTHQIRLGTDIGKHFYIEAGPVTYDGPFNDSNTGMSGEFGVDFDVTDRFSFKSKWEGVRESGELAHKIETELKFRF